MREWIPISTSPKGRLVLAAVERFGARPIESVTVGELAAAAEVTTVALYHHFGSKLGLYNVVRADVEQRLLDRMSGAAAGAAATGSSAVEAALLVGFEFAVREGHLWLVGTPPASTEPDGVAEELGASATRAVLPTSGPTPGTVLGHVLAAAWRAAVMQVAAGADPEEGKKALRALRVELAAP